MRQPRSMNGHARSMSRLGGGLTQRGGDGASIPGELRAQRLTHEGIVVTSTRSARIARRIALATLAVGLTVTSTGCSSQAGAAAVIDGRRIPVGDVQQATTDIAAFTGQDVAPSQVLFFLLLGPRLVNAAAANGVGVSEAQARQELATKVADPSESAVAAIRANDSLQALNTLGEDKAKPTLDAIVADLKKADIAVSPRYGQFDRDKVAIVPAVPNWLVADTTKQAAS